MHEFDNAIQGFENLNMEFSKITLDKSYSVKQATAIEIWFRENVVMYQATKQKRKETTHKTLLREKEKEILGHEKSQVALAQAIKGTVVEFPVEASQEDEDSASKVSSLSQIAV